MNQQDRRYPPAQPVEEAVAVAIRCAGIHWHRQHSPGWRDKPWHDGISVDLDEADVLSTLTTSVLMALKPYTDALALAAITGARWTPEGPLQRGCVHDTGDAVRARARAAVAPFMPRVKEEETS